MEGATGRGTTTGSQMVDGEFTYDVHPFRFPSATGITPRLVSSGAATPQRAPLGMFSQNKALSSFGSKFDKSQQWLTPRGEVGGKFSATWVCGHCPMCFALPESPANTAFAPGHEAPLSARSRPSYRHASGAQTERGRDRRADRAKPERERPQPQKRGARGLQAVQGVTWRFLREGTRRKTGAASTEVARDSRQGDGGVQTMHSAQEVQFDSLMSGRGKAAWGDGKQNLAAEYKSFEQNLHRRMVAEEARERGEDGAYLPIREDIRNDANLQGVLGDDDSSSSDDDKPEAPMHEELETGEDDDHVAVHNYSRSMSSGQRGDVDESGSRVGTMGEKAASFREKIPPLRTDSVDSHTSAQSARSVAGGGMNYDEDDSYLANPAMAPCVIWHTPMRVKIAANLPYELRAEVNGDDAFVQDQRVVPDIWDHKFLPVTRRSVAAPLPKGRCICLLPFALCLHICVNM